MAAGAMVVTFPIPYPVETTPELKLVGYCDCCKWTDEATFNPLEEDDRELAEKDLFERHFRQKRHCRTKIAIVG